MGDIRIHIKNDDEWILVQQLLFALGYSWNGGGQKFLSYKRDIILLCDKKMLFAHTVNPDDLSLEQFLDYIEQNVISYEV